MLRTEIAGPGRVAVHKELLIPERLFLSGRNRVEMGAMEGSVLRPLGKQVAVVRAGTETRDAGRDGGAC